MPTRIELPTCLIDTLKDLFPTLKPNWDRVSFFLGIPWPFSSGDQQAITLPSGYSGIHIYISEDEYQPCTQEFFVLCAHELVHALQIQESFAGGKGIGLLNPFSWKYLSCYFHEYSADEDEGNQYEDEAYRYEQILNNALNAVPAAAQRLPCSCDTVPFGISNAQFIGVNALAGIDPRAIKRKVESKGACRARIFGGLKITGTHEGDNVFGWTLLGAIIGLIVCAGFPGCAVIGALIGGLIGILDVHTGIPSGIVTAAIVILGAFGWEGFAGAVIGAVIGAFLCGPPCALVGALLGELIGGLVGAIVSALTDWLAPGDRPLRVIFSQDDGLTFADPVTVGATGEPPALAFSQNQLFIGWVSSDNKLNLLTAPNPRSKKWEWASDDCGPALAWGDNRLHLVWQRKKNRLLSSTSTNAQDFTPRVRIGGKVPDDATPGITFGNARSFVAWIRKKNNKVGIKSSANSGVTWGQEATLDERSRNHGSAAVAFGNGRLYLAWATKKRQYLHIATLSVSGSGTASMSSNLNLDVRCKKNTGPALAFGNSRLFVAWVGRGKQKLNVRSFDVSASGGLTQRSDVRLEQRAKKNAGPALAYGMNILVLGWVRKNR